MHLGRLLCRQDSHVFATCVEFPLRAGFKQLVPFFNTSAVISGRASTSIHLNQPEVSYGGLQSPRISCLCQVQAEGSVNKPCSCMAGRSSRFLDQNCRGSRPPVDMIALLKERSSGPAKRVSPSCALLLRQIWCEDRFAVLFARLLLGWIGAV